MSDGKKRFTDARAHHSTRCRDTLRVMLERNVSVGVGALARTQTTSHRVRIGAVKLLLAGGGAATDDDDNDDDDGSSNDSIDINDEEREEAVGVVQVRECALVLSDHSHVCVCSGCRTSCLLARRARNAPHQTASCARVVLFARRLPSKWR